MSSLSRITTYNPPVVSHRCPICDIQGKKETALSIVKVGVATLLPPFAILQNLKNSNLVPCDTQGNTIRTPNRWRNTLHFHVESCLGGDYEIYERAWQAKQKTLSLSSEFRQTVKRQGITGNEDDDELRMKMLIINSLGNDPQQLANLTQEGLLNREQLLQVFRTMMPTILAQQLQIVSMAQTDYLTGVTTIAPVKEFNSVKKCLEVLKMVIGEYGIENTIGNE